MKNTYKLFKIIALAVLVGFLMVACNDDSDGNGNAKIITFTVTFDSDGGSTIPGQVVNKGKEAEEPLVPPTKGLEGLYLGEVTADDVICTFDGWFAPDSETEFDFTTKITGDITLTARWIDPNISPIDIESQTGTGIIAKAIRYINNNADTYTLLINDDVDLSSQSFSTANVKLTIIGIGSEREIRLSSNGRMFTIGSLIRTGIELTLGNNITLVGRSVDGNGNQNNTNSVVRLQDNASFTMLSGSKITGNTSTGTDGSAAAVDVSSGVFTMKSGSSITGNTATFTNPGYPGIKVVSGLYHGGDEDTVFNIEGGCITGNTALTGDVSINGKMILSENAAIGSLTIFSRTDSDFSSRHNPLTIAPGWTGTVQVLNLYGYRQYIGTNPIETVIDRWVNNTVLQAAAGYTLQKSDVEKILSLGTFISSSSNISTKAISPDYKIEDSGVDIGKLVAATP